MRGEKQLHNLSQNKTLISMFTQDELVSLENRGVTTESYYVFTESGVDVKKCAQCKFWGNVRTLFHMYGMTACAPCNFEKK